MEDPLLSKNLLRSTILVGQMTLVSRILGLVRDAVIAAVFGASQVSDAFFVAFKIPNLFRRLFAEGAFAQAFVPVLSAHRAAHDEPEVRALADAVTGALGTVLLAFTCLGVLAAPLIITIVAPGFVANAAKFELSVTLLRLTFPYLFFIALTALLAGILNTYGHFAIPALTPALLNVALILCAVWLAPNLSQPVIALGAGVLVGGILQLGLQIAAAARAGILPRPRWHWRHPGVQRILTLMLPALFGVSIAQINFLIDTLIASFLREGSISWLYFADRLMEFPLGLFGIALGTVIMPSLSEYFAKDHGELFSDTLDWAIRVVLLITVPSAIGLAVLAEPILSTLFQYGRMSEYDVAMSAMALVPYAFGLSGFILIKVLAPGYFSRQDVSTPVRVGAIALLANLVLNLLLVWPLAHAGLALATSLAAFVNAGLLLRILLRKGVYRPRAGWFVHLLRIVLASTLMAAILMWLNWPLAQWSAWAAGERVVHLAALIVTGVVTYAASCVVLGVRRRDVAQPRPTV